MTARVLVVDDILSNVKLLEAKLTAEYFEVITAFNGLECLAKMDQAPDIVLLFKIPNTSRTVNLQHFIPRHFHNAWVVVAVALVGSAVIKSICDYLGTLLANKAGFGMITDLRNDLYNSVLRRSTAFFQRHTTGTLLSTLINDVERVQTALSTVMSDFLQQLFTMLFLIVGVIVLGPHEDARAHRPDEVLIGRQRVGGKRQHIGPGLDRGVVSLLAGRCQRRAAR